MFSLFVLDVVVNICNPNTQKLRQEDHGFKAILGEHAKILSENHAKKFWFCVCLFILIYVKLVF